MIIIWKTPHGRGKTSNHNSASECKTDDVVADIRHIMQSARARPASSVNCLKVYAYWRIGRRIVQEEQNGKAKAAYGEKLLKTLASKLQDEFGRGFAEQSLRNYRQFYLCYQKEDEIRSALRSELSFPTSRNNENDR